VQVRSYRPGWRSAATFEHDKELQCRRAVHIGGVKVVAEHRWLAARPSGTEDIYKLYAESLRGEEHLERILVEAQEVVDAALAAGEDT
jgi:phosphoglucomutase